MNDSVPEKLYRYQPLRSPEMMDWLKKSVLENQIYFSSPSSFNDPFDCKVPISVQGTVEQQRSYIEPIVREMLAGPQFIGSSADQIRTIKERLLGDPKRCLEGGQTISQERIIPLLGVYCVSERCDDILMWSHYADAHRGVCLILAGSKMYSRRIAVEQVQYPLDNRYPDVNFFTATEQEKYEAVLLTKANHWAYEREWRILDATGPGWHDIAPDWLLGLVFGCATPIAQIAEVSRMALQRKPQLRLFQAQKLTDRFGLVVNPYKNPLVEEPR
jgi:Protein of unknown function (DUF2971)